MPRTLKSGTNLFAGLRRDIAIFHSKSPEWQAKAIDAIEATIATGSKRALESQSIQAIYRMSCGDEAFETFMSPYTEFDAVEYAAAVDSSLFSRITSNLVKARVVQAYQFEQFVFTQLIPSRPAENLWGDKIPGITTLSDDAAEVQEGQNYARAVFGDEYIETPASKKRGLIVDVTREAVWQNRTRNILQQAAQVGFWLGLNKEKRLCDMVIGATNSYKRNGTAVDTYQTAAPWINDHSNELLDYTDIENSDVLQSRIVDPNTGEAIMLESNALVVTKAKEITAKHILGATRAEMRTNSGNNIRDGFNPVADMASSLRVSRLMENRIVSQLSQTRADAAKYWFMGDFENAFSYEEVFALDVTQAPVNSVDAYERDIISSYKASERGVPAVLDPRRVVRNKA